MPTYDHLNNIIKHPHTCRSELFKWKLQFVYISSNSPLNRLIYTVMTAAAITGNQCYLQNNHPLWLAFVLLSNAPVIFRFPFEAFVNDWESYFHPRKTNVVHLLHPNVFICWFTFQAQNFNLKIIHFYMYVCSYNMSIYVRIMSMDIPQKEIPFH